MSTTSNADLIATYESIILNGRAVYATAALVFFEHLVTFKYEVDFLWRRKWSAATWIFVFNRYLLILNMVAGITPDDAQICDDSRAMNTLTFFTDGEISILPAHLFTVLRTFALLQDHSWRRAVTCTLIAWTLATVALTSYTNFTGTWIYADDPILGGSCDEIGYTVSVGLVNRVTVVSSITAIISASIVLVITIMQTVRQVQQASILGLKTTLSEVLLRDGSLFFLGILVQDIFSAIPTLNGLLLSGPVSYITIPLLNVLPQLLLSRFIINLRQVDSPGTNTSTDQHPSRFSIPNFRVPTMDEVVGNLGEPLEFGEYRADAEDDAQDGAHANENATRQDAVTASWPTGVSNVEAVDPSNGGGVGDTHADVLDIDGIELEELRASPTLRV